MENNGFVFTYGSNISDRRIRERGVKPLTRERATLEGYRLTFSVLWRDGFACTTILPDPDSKAHGSLYTCDEEGFQILERDLVNNGKYQRESVKVQKASGEEVNAMVYVARKEHVQEGLTPSLKYIDIMLEAEDVLPKEYADNLRNLKVQC